MILTVVILPAWVLPAPADGIFGLFGKKAKANPAQRVPELISIVKSDQEERKRASAATELGTFDATAFGEIVPVLVDVLQSDPKPGVRSDAASSLENIRPVSQLAGQALEKASSSDANWRVRMHAKGLLLKYRIAGYSPGPKGEVPNPTGPKTIEPPLLDTHAAIRTQPNPKVGPPPALFPTGPTPATTTSLIKGQVPEAKKDNVLEFRPSVPRTLPKDPLFTTSVPQQISPPALQPLPMVEGEGPELTPLPTIPSQKQSPPKTPEAGPPLEAPF